MKPVTDPAILAQLQSGTAGGRKPVTDPAILAQLGGQQEQPQQTPEPGVLAGINDYSNNLTREFINQLNRTAIDTADLLVKTGNMTAGGYNAMLSTLRGESPQQVSDAANIQPMTLPSQMLDSGREAMNTVLPESIQQEAIPGYAGPYMDEGLPRDAARAAGALTFAAGGLQTVPGRDLTKTSGQAAEFLGFGSASPQQTASTIASTLDDSPPITATGPDPSLPNNFPAKVVNDTVLPTPKGRIARIAARDAAVKRQGGQAVAAGYKLDDAGNVVKDAAQKKAIDAGIDKGIVAQIAASSKTDKSQIKKMMLVVKRGLQDKTFSDFNLPRQVLGDSLYGRYAPVAAENRKAGAAVNQAVAKLKDVPFNATAFNDGPLRTFTEALNEMGVKVSRSGKVNFRGSDFEGTTGARAIIAQTLKRIYDTDVTTLKDVHRLKKFIDEMADEYGSSSTGLSASAQNVVKALRHDTNQFIREFAPPEYAAANDTYSESIEVLNDLRRLIGKNNAATPADLARTARKALSNMQTSGQVMKLIDDLDTLATKYGANFDDDLKTQMSVVQSIEKLFPSAKPAASFSGDIDKSLEAFRRASGQPTGTTMGDLVLMGIDKMTKKTPDQKQEALITAIEELIASGQK